MEEKVNKVLKSKVTFIVACIVGVLIFLSIGVATAIRTIADWGAEHQIVDQQMISLKIQSPLKVVDREPHEVISPLAEELLEPREDLTPIEEKVVSRWGERYGYIALAVFRCESGLRPDAVNWETRDLGLTQINWPTWEKPILEKFGFHLVDMFNEDINLDVAYWIWDRANGIEGDNIGSFEPWVAFTSGSFRGCIK